MALTKADLVRKVVKEIGYTRVKSTELVGLVLETIKKSLVSGDDVLISGFGKLCVKQKAARRGRNPITGERMTLKPRKVVVFRCSAKLRDKINSYRKIESCNIGGR